MKKVEVSSSSVQTNQEKSFVCLFSITEFRKEHVNISGELQDGKNTIKSFNLFFIQKQTDPNLGTNNTMNILEREVSSDVYIHILVQSPCTSHTQISTASYGLFNINIIVGNYRYDTVCTNI